MNLFKELGLNGELLTTIERLKFTEPTDIQKKSIPSILEGKDVIGASATGSGKTLAFGCGIVQNITTKKGLQSLILVPTRELAEQVKNSIKQLVDSKDLKVIAIYGGVAINPQIGSLRRANVVVATPGRLLDHLQRRTVDTSKVKILVMDEADRMFDMGFIDDVRKIIQTCPNERQTLFFSATISSEINDFSRRYMTNPMMVSAITYVDPSKLKQVYYDNLKHNKLSLLVHLLKKENNVEQAMIFCNTRRTTDFVVANLKANGVKSAAIHGGLSQNKRTGVLKSFDDGKIFALVCTDVAARGLHIDNVSHIYNYEVPVDSKDYVHRIGRTARAGEDGKAVNLLGNPDYPNFSKILNDYPNFDIGKKETPVLENITTVRVEKKQFQNNRQRRPFKRKTNWKGKRGYSNKFSKPRQNSFKGPRRIEII